MFLTSLLVPYNAVTGYCCTGLYGKIYESHVDSQLMINYEKLHVSFIKRGTVITDQAMYTVLGATKGAGLM